MELKKRVLLVYLSLSPPDGSASTRGSKTVKLSRRYYESEVLPPLGLMYLSSSLKKNGWDVILYDQRLQNRNDESPARLLEIIRREKPVFTGFYSDEFLSPKVAFYVKTLASSSAVPVVVGGPGWLNYELFLSHGASAVCVGEGEETIHELAACFYDGVPLMKVKGIYINDNGNVARTPEKTAIADLDSISFPDYDGIPLKKYFNVLDPMSRRPLTTIITSRGCPFRCTYCIVPVLSSSRIRHRSPENVVDELKYLTKFHGVKYVYFYDEIFGWRKGWIERFCELVLKERVTFKWSCYIYPNSIKKNYQFLFPLMKRAGFARMNVGLQSLDNRVLKSINREALDFEYISRLLVFARKTGIFTSVDFIIGQPGDSEESMRSGIDFASKNGVHKININTIKIMYGSQLYREIHSGEKKLSYTDDVLYDMEKRLYRKFFLSFKNFFRTAFFILLKNPLWFIHGIKLWNFLWMDVARGKLSSKKI